MHEDRIEENFELIRAKDPRYHREAYLLVERGLAYTQKSLGRKKRGATAHVTGQELLEGIREVALAEFGPMAVTVLEEWGVHSCHDFGQIVFNMINIDWLGKTATDSQADFENGYDFCEAFRKPFLPSGKQGVPEPVKALERSKAAGD
jgi:uncharacterized repeat protein (TIGR04138 family)